MAELTAQAVDSLSATAQTAAEEASAAAEAARTASTEAADANASAKKAVGLLEGLSVELDPSTTRFRFWQQILAWSFGGAAIVLALIGALKDSVATELWAVIGGFILAAIVASFRSKTVVKLGGDGESDGGGGETDDEPRPPTPTPPAGG